MDKDNAIVRNLSGIVVLQRSSDGYVNATQLINAHKARTGEGKKFSNWLKTAKAKAYIAYVSREVGIPTSDLVEPNHGSRDGSWLHPDLAVSFASWLSVEFEFQVNKWVQEWMRTGQNPIAVKQSREEIIRSLLPAQPLTWHQRYKPDFWAKLHELYGYKQGNPACAIWINKYVYGYFPQEVRDRLDEINPLINGKRKNLQHCHFDGTLLQELEKHLTLVFGFLRAAESSKDFERLMNANFKGIQQYQLWGAEKWTA